MKPPKEILEKLSSNDSSFNTYRSKIEDSLFKKFRN